MRSCPACGFENADDANQCGRCHLAVGLFDAVREAVGVPETDPRYLAGVAEVLQAVGEAGPSGSPDPSVTRGRIAQPARFLSIPPSALPAERPVRPPESLPQMPALPRGDVLPALRHQVDELLQLGRRQGVDLTDFTGRAKEAVLAQDVGSLEVLHRDLFVHLAAAMSAEFDRVLAKRDELAHLVPTPSANAELESCRQALSAGDLAGAQRRLRHIEEGLTDLEDHWATAQILTAEAELLAETVRELGGDPAPALGPLDEGRRLARLGRREEAEPVLARSAYALWSILSPLLSKDLARLRTAIVARRESGADVAPAIEDLKDLAAHLRHRNFAAAVGAYRRLRAFVDSVGPVAEAEPPAGAGGPAAPSG